MVMLSAVQMFEAVGFDALVAFTTDEAIAHLEGRSGIAVVFAEYDAPGSLDGPALARLVRGRWPTIEIIAVSGRRAAFELDDLPLGARYFEKPYALPQIERALEQLGLIGAVPRARASAPPRG